MYVMKEENEVNFPNMAIYVDNIRPPLYCTYLWKTEFARTIAIMNITWTNSLTVALLSVIKV